MGLNTGPPTSPNMVDANMMDMECVIGEMDASELTFSHHMGNDMIPSPPIDNTNQVAAWYDTDLWAAPCHYKTNFYFIIFFKRKIKIVYNFLLIIISPPFFLSNNSTSFEHSGKCKKKSFVISKYKSNCSIISFSPLLQFYIAKKKTIYIFKICNFAEFPYDENLHNYNWNISFEWKQGETYNLIINVI